MIKIEYQFKSLVGNTTNMMLLKGMIKRNTTPKFLIFDGEYGTGKSTCATIMAMALNCENNIDGEPCCKCKNCQSIMQNNIKSMNHLRTNVPEKLDKKDFRELIKETFSLQLSENKYVHTIRDEVLQTMLLEQIDNLADNTFIIMTTTKSLSLIPMLRSRATIFTFSRLSNEESLLLLDKECKKRNIEMSKQIKNLIISNARGIPRDLLKLLDFIINNKVTLAELQDYLHLISDEDFLQLFIALANENKFSEVIMITRELIDTRGTESFIKGIKDFYLRAIFAIEADITTTFNKNIRDELKSILGVCETSNIDVNRLMTLGNIFSKLTFNMSEDDIIFNLLIAKQYFKGKSLAQIKTDNKSEAQIRVKQLEEEKQTDKIIIQSDNKLNKMTLEDLKKLNVFK